METISNKKNYFLNLGSNFVGTIIGTCVSIVAIPISLNYWKVEKYGVWVLITSMLVYLSMTNLGLSSAATTLIAKNPNFHDKLKIAKRALKIMMGTVVLGIIGFVLLNLFDKEWIIILGKIPAYLKEQTFYACLILGFFYLVNIPFSLISSLFIGFQKAYVDNIFNSIGYVGNFCCLLLVIAFKGNLILFAFFWGSFLLLIDIAKYVYFHFAIYNKLDLNKSVIPQTEEKDEIKTRFIFITGMRFFFISLAAMVVWNTDNFVISNFLGIQSVTPYSVTFRLYNVLFLLICMVNASIMPIMAREFGLNNWEWINRTYNSFLVLASIIGGLSWIGGLAFFKDVINLWAGTKGYAGLLCVFALGGYSYLLSMVNLNSVIINTFNYTKRAAFIGWLEALLKISFSILLLHFWGMGGVALGTLLGSLLAPTLILPRWIVRRSDNRMKYNLNFVIKHFTLVLLPLLVLGVLAQLFVSGIILRLSIGVMAVAIYTVSSYFLIPVDVKHFLKKNLNRLLIRIGINIEPENPDAFTANESSSV